MRYMNVDLAAHEAVN